MAKKLTLTIDTVHFDIDVEDEFADFLTMQMSKDFHIDGNNDLKDLLQAYVRRNYALFKLEKECDNLNNRVEASLNN